MRMLPVRRAVAVSWTTVPEVTGEPWDPPVSGMAKSTDVVASSSQEDLVRAWEVVRDSFGEHDVPSTLLGVTVLGYDDQLVEIESVAALRE